MKKLIAIGQSVLDIIHVDYKPAISFTGGRIANMAVSLGRLGVGVEFVSECGKDCVGDMIVGYLKENGVGVASVDRFTDGLSQVSLVFRDNSGGERYSEYVKYPATRFNVLWPKIEENDIVVFGSFFSIDDGPRQHLLELLAYAQERKAIIVYLPGFQPELCSRITRVMPAIFENLEFADIVIARESDMVQIFGKSDSKRCYDDHILFYCPNFLFVDNGFNIRMHAPHAEITRMHTGILPTNKLGWNASLCAGFMHGLLKGDVTRNGLVEMAEKDWAAIVDRAAAFAANSAATGENAISRQFAEEMR